MSGHAAALERPHGDGCDCVRCAGFMDGNVVAVKHGAYSRRLLEGDAERLAEEIASVAPDATSPAVALAGLTFAQVIRAERALREAPEGADLSELKRDAHRWHGRLESMLTRLGLLASKDGQVVNIANVLQTSPEWQGLQARITAALRPHPQALAAVLAAIEDAEVVDAD